VGQSRDEHERELVASAYLGEIFEGVRFATSPDDIDGDMTQVQKEGKITT
jgi:hypothetical protein